MELGGRALPLPMHPARLTPLPPARRTLHAPRRRRTRHAPSHTPPPPRHCAAPGMDAEDCVAGAAPSDRAVRSPRVWPPSTACPQVLALLQPPGSSRLRHRPRARRPEYGRRRVPARAQLSAVDRVPARAHLRPRARRLESGRVSASPPHGRLPSTVSTRASALRVRCATRRVRGAR